MDQSEEFLEDMKLQEVRQGNVRVQVPSSNCVHGRFGWDGHAGLTTVNVFHVAFHLR